MNNVDYDKKKYRKDAYGNLYRRKRVSRKRIIMKFKRGEAP